jgi:tRNA A-37 threonylcarbamoyl transferase component Bud32
MARVAGELARLHSFGLVFNTLAPANIYTTEEHRVFFADWTLVRPANSQQRLSPALLELFDQVPSATLAKGGVEQAADILTLKSIFKQIIDAVRSPVPETVRDGLEQLVSRMGEKIMTVGEVASEVRELEDYLVHREQAASTSNLNALLATDPPTLRHCRSKSSAVLRKGDKSPARESLQYRENE